MPVIVIGSEEKRYRDLPEDDPKKVITEVWTLFLDFRQRSVALVKTGQTQECARLRGPQPIPGVQGRLLFPRFECCDEHRELGRLREKIVALLDEHDLNKARPHNGSNHDPLSEGWWRSHGFEWDSETPIVQSIDEVPEG